jgi:hypothetical protein
MLLSKHAVNYSAPSMFSLVFKIVEVNACHQQKMIIQADRAQMEGNRQIQLTNENNKYSTYAIV